VREALAPQHPWLFRIYYAGTLLGALALFVLAAPHVPAMPWLTLIFVWALMLFSEASPINLPSGGYATASAVFDLPSLIILGPFYTAGLDIASTLIVQGLVMRKPAVKVIFNMACFAITDFAAGYAFTLAGGQIGRLSLSTDVGALLACGGVYFLVNSALVSTVIGLTAGPNPWRIWQRNFQSGILHHLSFIALGTLVAVTYFGTGPWGLVLFGIPFLVARQAFRLYVEIRSDLKDFVRALTEVLDEIDPYTRHHSVRVAEYSVRLARALRLNEHEVEEIEYAALVHDLGKIGPQHQRILQKPGGLSQEEHRTLRAHPAAGAEIVGKVRALRRASEIVRSHPEQPDGRGYPYGLRSVDVPLGARILKVTDAFDATTSDRPYRRALSIDAALAELDAARAPSSTPRSSARCCACTAGALPAHPEPEQRRPAAPQPAPGPRDPLMRYRDAGVDIARADALKQSITREVTATWTPGVRRLVGGFAGVMEWPSAPSGPGGAMLLAATMDGVGTKLHLAQAAGRVADAAADLVYHGANDLLVHGARPLALLDYVAQERLDGVTVLEVVRGLSRACREVGAALLGGETAEMPSTYRPDVVDVAGCMIGIVSASALRDGSSVRPGDVVLGLASDGLHTNGYSLARRVLEASGLGVDARLPGGGGETIGDALLAPHRWYGRAMLPELERDRVHALAHVTGGGIAGNLSRVLPAGCRARVRADAWPRPAVFRWLAEAGAIPEEDAREAFNLGIGLVVVCASGAADAVASELAHADERVFVLGDVIAGDRGVEWIS
jgi:phosphoribosylformylglycinamidine cyclo-ligase